MGRTAGLGVGSHSCLPGSLRDPRALAPQQAGLQDLHPAVADDVDGRGDVRVAQIRRLHLLLLLRCHTAAASTAAAAAAATRCCCRCPCHFGYR